MAGASDETEHVKRGAGHGRRHFVQAGAICIMQMSK
jgi:hypothetical protein